MKLVIWPAIDEQRRQRIDAVSTELVVVNAESLTTAQQAMSDADAFFGKLTPELLNAAGQLKWVQSPTASLEHYVFPELLAHPCQLTNMRGLFSDVIADHVLGYVLAFARNLHVYLRQQRRAVWSPVGGEEQRTDFVSGPGQVTSIDRAHRHLADCTLGVIGVGEIGSEILRRAAAFGMSVQGVDPHPRKIDGLDMSSKPLDRLPRLLSESDFVVMAAPHTPETEGSFGERQFRQMKRDAVFINIGRGAIVPLADLVRALDHGWIGGAALDVFEVEPLPADHPLWTRPNVILTPHIAAASPRIAERHLQTFLENLRRFLDGAPLFTPVDKAKWY